MKPIKFNEFIAFTKARNNGYQKCIYCEGKIGKGNVALNMIKKCSGGNYNVWLHINCIEKFFEDIIKFKAENLKSIVAETFIK